MPSEIELAQLEDLLAQYKDIRMITIDKDGVITFSLGQIDLEMIEKMDGHSQALKDAIPLGTYDIIVAPGADEPLVRNRLVRRKYGKIKGKPETLVWDHPHILDMRVQSPDFLKIISPLIHSENWEQVVCQTVMFLSSATLWNKMSLQVLKLWASEPTEDELISVS